MELTGLPDLLPATGKASNLEAAVRVLVVEDDQLLADTLAEGLRQSALAVDVAYHGDDALDRVLVTRYDVVVLDRDLPGIAGDEMCRHIVEYWDRTVRVLMTGTADMRSRVTRLNLGADDYLPKPFAFAELAARVRALLRRAGPASAPVSHRAGGRLDPARFEVPRDDRPIRLTPKEFAVLRTLLGANGAVIGAEELLDRVWDEQADLFANNMRTVVAALHKKLGPPTVIETLVGAGYRIP